MVNLHNIFALKNTLLRVGLNRQRCQCDKIAFVTQHAVGDRADPGGAAGYKPADSGDLLGRGEHRHFPAIGNQRRVDVGHQCAGFGADEPLANFQHAVHCSRFHNQPAVHRHRLAVVARPAATQHDRRVVGIGRRKHMAHFVTILGACNQIAETAPQFIVKDRAVPEEVATAFLDQYRLVDDFYGRKGFGKSSPVNVGFSGYRSH